MFSSGRIEEIKNMIHFSFSPAAWVGGGAYFWTVVQPCCCDDWPLRIDR